MRIDRPAEDDTPHPGSGSSADTPSAAAGPETPERVACAAGYRAAVDATYREYRAAQAAAESADHETGNS